MNRCVVALIPCKNGAASIAETVSALMGIKAISRVLVIDDGSTDNTAVTAAQAGAEVIRLPVNQGKGGALQAGVDATPEADVYVLVDADTRASAASVAHLLPAVIGGEAQLAIGVLPAAGGRGGFGLVRDTAARGIQRSCGYVARAPLSGQRAIDGGLLRTLELAPRFGVEVAMTIDAVRRGATVVEMDVEMDHQHHGKTPGGFLHRARQGWDVVRALQPRILSSTVRAAVLILITMICLGLLIARSGQSPTGEPSTATAQPLPKANAVQVVLVPGWTWSDYRSTGLPGVLDPTLPSITGSLATGHVKDLATAVATGSRDDKQRASDVRVEIYDRSAPVKLPDARVRIIAGVTTKEDETELRPIVLQGNGLLQGASISGTFISASTKRAGIVDLTDIAPTVVAMQSHSPQTGTSALRYLPGGEPNGGPNDDAVNDIAATADRVHFYDQHRTKFIVVFVVAQLLVYAAAWLRRNDPKAPKWWTPFALAIAAVPAASMLTQWIFSDKLPSVSTWSACCIAIVAIIVGMSGLASRATLGLQRVLLVTIAVITADIIGDDTLQLGGFFGSSPALGARYYGLGNVASVLLITATVLWVTLCIHVAAQTGPAARERAWWRSLSIAFLVTAVIGAPGLGSDVGGLFTSIVTFSLLFMALRVNAFAWKRMILAGAGALLALVVAASVDAQRPTRDQTHLGQLAGRIGNEGVGPLFDVIVRKVDANVLSYAFPWSLTVIAVSIAFLAGLLGHRWVGTLPKSAAKSISPERIGAIAAVTGSALAYGVNDSGIVILVLVAVFLGPYLMVFHRRNRWDIPNVEVLAP